MPTARNARRDGTPNRLAARFATAPITSSAPITAIAIGSLCDSTNDYDAKEALRRGCEHALSTELTTVPQEQRSGSNNPIGPMTAVFSSPEAVEDSKVETQSVAIIMAGGQGERLWPLSTPERPKQLLKLLSEELTMLDQAIERIRPLVGDDAVYVSTSTRLGGPIAASGALDADHVLAEPAKRNTLGALVWSVAHLVADGFSEDSAVAVLTADHHIGDEDAFRRDAAGALDLAVREASIVTLGIVPDRPDIGYGYLETDAEDSTVAANGVTAYRCRAFKEKPDLETAERFVAAGNFYWNSGMFFFTLGTFRRELESAGAEACAAFDEVVEALRQDDEATAKVAFERLPDLSVDYAVMERANRILTVPSSFDWDDLGSWDAVARKNTSDDSDNVIRGLATLIESRNTLVINENPDITIGVMGINDAAIILTKDGLLVCKREFASRLKELLKELP
ncbi:hypothetical protein EON81_00330 [bacterium]|nr:MAG: hypothetical protein EON81_00330 [bacterium]